MGETIINSGPSIFKIMDVTITAVHTSLLAIKSRHFKKDGFDFLQV
jgi:hypothetical protein